MAGFNQGFNVTVFVEAGADAMWARMRALTASNGHFTVPGLVKSIRQRKDTIVDYVRRLEKGGFVVRVGKEPTPTGYAVLYAVDSKRAEAPRVDRQGVEYPETKNERMWRSMKMLKHFTVDELAAAASIDERTVSVETAKTYVKHLKAAGILTAIPRVKRKGSETYRLAKNLGAQPPRILAAKLVYDPNVHEIVSKEIEAKGADA